MAAEEEVTIQEDVVKEILLKLPEDLATEILLKLPAKYIMRLRCVSEFLNSLITNPIFIKNHLEKAKQGKQLLLLRPKNPVSYSLHLDNHGLDRCSRLEFPIQNEVGLCLDRCSRLEFPIQNEVGLFEMFGSCNGVVCLLSRYLQIDSSRRLLLWNPSIKKTLDLPAPRSWAASDKTLLGLGYDPGSDDYKIARVVMLDDPSESPFAFQCYSLNLAYWNENADVSNTLAANEDTLRKITPFGFELDNQVIVNGVIHWFLLNCRDVIDIGLPSMDINSIFALSFNLSNDSFGEIMMPACFDPTKRATEMSISVFNNSLTFNIFDRNYMCEIWMMKLLVNMPCSQSIGYTWH